MIRTKSQVAALHTQKIIDIDRRIRELRLLQELDRVVVAPHWFDELLDRRNEHQELIRVMEGNG